MILSPPWDQGLSKLSGLFPGDYSQELHVHHLLMVGECQRHQSTSLQHHSEGHQMEKIIYKNSPQNEYPIRLGR